MILAQFMVGYVMWTAARLPALARVRAWRPAPAGSHLAAHPPLSLRLAACCNIVMGLAMGYMLIISL